MWMLLLLLLVVFVAYMLFLRPSGVGGLFEDYKDVKENYPEGWQQ